MSTYDRAAASCTLFDPGRHEILGEYPWLLYLRGVAKTDRLFAVRFRETGLFGVGVWVFSPKEAGRPIFEELVGFSGSPTAPWPEGLMSPEDAKKRFRPYDEVKREADARDRADRAARLQDIGLQQDARKTTAKILRKRGLTTTADLIRDGQLPLRHNEEAREQWNDEFATARRRSAIVDGFKGNQPKDKD